MKILKRIIFILLGIVALLAVIGYFMPAQVHVERSVKMHQHVPVVFNYVNDLHNWNSWSPWYEKDPKAKIEYSGPQSGTGSTMHWESDVREVGKGRMQIVQSNPDSVVGLDLYFMSEETPTRADFRMNEAGDSTIVTWSLAFDAGMNPFKRLMGKFMDGMVGPDFEKGLAKLKSINESLPPEMKVEETELPAMNYFAVRDTASIPTISTKLGTDYHMIGAVMKKQNLIMAGPPFAIYYSDSQTNWELDAAVPLNKPGKTEGNVRAGTMKAGKALVVHYHGAYDRMHGAYEALHEYASKNGKKINGAPWESYISDPMSEKDTAKWATDIYFPVE